MSATPSPKSPEQTEKHKRYDRQLRLWGDHGQTALESSHICAINATATATETLKSLILPCIASFTIIDCAQVTQQDIGNNFFLESEFRGGSRSRGEIACALLKELNNDVHGEFIDETVEQMLKQPGFFSKFSLVVATELPEKVLLELSTQLWELKVPLIVCKSNGFIGYIRVQVNEHTVIESHPLNTMEDLRLNAPFPELIEHMQEIDLEAMKKSELYHTPYLILLFKRLEEWKKDFPYPSTYKEKNKFKEMLEKRTRGKLLEEDEDLPDNFGEAVKAVNKILIPTTIPKEIQELLDDDQTNITNKSTKFWIQVKAVKEFVNKEGQGQLPLKGTIPDMMADSAPYIKLQTVYRERAHKDAECVYKHVHHMLQQHGFPTDHITESQVRKFCKNSHDLRLVRGTRLVDEYNQRPAYVSDLSSQLEETDNNEFVWYVMLRAVDRFQSEFGRIPGLCDDQVEPDIIPLKSHVNKLLGEWGLGSLVQDDYIHEMCRYGGAELHAVAAFVGGCAAHEGIKILTKQYVPLNSTFIYNAMKSTTASFRL